MSAGIDGRVRTADVVVIGAGQAGLSAAYHLQRRGFVPAGTGPDARDAAGGPARSYIVLDAEDGPGGAWRHRWKSLLMATVNGISDLPGIPQPAVDPDEASSSFLTRYFGGYEHQLGAGHRTSRQGPVRLPGGQRRRRAAAHHHVPRRLVCPGHHQRDRHLDPAVLADLPGPGHASADGSCTLRTTSPRRNSAAGT